jgi:hypothetical protein
MTEEEWLACGDPRPMLAFLRGKVSDRKLRLFSGAATTVWSRVRPTLRRYAAWRAGPTVLADLESLAQSAGARWASGPDPFAGAHNWASAACAECGSDRELLLAGPLYLRQPLPPRRHQAALLAWDGGTVVRLAQAAGDQRAEPKGLLDAIRLSVLADALEDAGGADPGLISHLRSPEPHVRGCWAVDLILAKDR